MTVVRLEAWCDLVESPEGTASFRVEEHAVLADGSRLLLTDDPGGWSLSVRGAGDVWQFLSIAQVERDVLNVTLPDDAEQSGETHEWAAMAQVLRSLGIETEVPSLKALPYEIVLSPQVRDRLGSQ